MNHSHGDFLNSFKGHIIISATTPSPNADQTNQTDESKQQQIAPQTDELDAEQLDQVAGGSA
jgi:hypothetical protein